MAWMVVKNHLDPDEDMRVVGTGQGDTANENPPHISKLPNRCKLYDDDGELYYTVAYNDVAMDEDEEYGGLYQCYHWGMYYAGTTDLRINGESIYG